MDKPRLFKLSSIMTFGQYKGMTVKEVIDYDPAYMMWVVDNVEWFVLNKAAEEYLDAAEMDNEKSYGVMFDPLDDVSY